MLGACTERVAVGPEGEFSWEPQSQMIWPVEGAIVSAYGDAARPSHQGIDLAARAGDPVAAARLGRVEFVGEIPGYGNVVVLSHADRLSTIYAHLSAIRVHEGDAVSRGQTLASVAFEGYLHYEIREAKQPVDPAKFYAVAPRPLAGISTDVREKLAREPASVGALGDVGEVEKAPKPPAIAATPAPRPVATPSVAPTAPPIPTPAIAPTPRPTVKAAPPSPAPRADTGFHPERIPAPLETPPPPPPRRPSEAPAPSPPPPSEPTPRAESGGGWGGIGMGAALVGANLLYLPAKLAYAGVGAVTGTIVLVLAHDTAVANDVWTPTLGGDYLVTERHLRGEEPVRFLGGR